jgi:hypothetical protein
MKNRPAVGRATVVALLVAVMIVPAALAAKGGGGGGGAGTGASITFNPTAAVVGQEYLVVGSGFRPNTWVTVGAHFSDTTWWNSQISDAQGKISLSFTATRPGQVYHEAKQQGQNGRLRLLATATLAVNPS